MALWHVHYSRYAPLNLSPCHPLLVSHVVPQLVVQPAVLVVQQPVLVTQDLTLKQESGLHDCWFLTVSVAIPTGWNSGATALSKVCGSAWGLGCLTLCLSYTGNFRKQYLFSLYSECSNSCSTVCLPCLCLFLGAHWFCWFRSKGKLLTGCRRLWCRTWRVHSQVSDWTLNTGPSPILSTTWWNLFSQ